MVLSSLFFVFAIYALLLRADIDNTRKLVNLDLTVLECLTGKSDICPAEDASDPESTLKNPLNFAEHYVKDREQYYNPPKGTKVLEPTEYTPQTKTHFVGYKIADQPSFSAKGFSTPKRISCPWWSPEDIKGCFERPRPDRDSDWYYINSVSEPHWGVARRLTIGEGPSRVELYIGRRLSLAVVRQTFIVGAFLFLGGAVTLAIGLGFWISRRILKRVDDVNAVCDRVAHNELALRVPGGDARDEFGELSRHVNRMLDRLERQVQELQNFSRHIAHDLRRPIGRLKHNLEAVADADDLVLARSGAEAAIDETDDLLRTFDALLHICQVEMGAVGGDQPVRLDEAARKAVDLYAQVAEEKDVRLSLDAAPLTISGEPALVEQLAANFIDNAIKFSPPGGQVRVTVESAARGATLRVRDEGPGIPAALRATVTQRFSRLDAARGVEGHGLGLALAQAIADRHDTTLDMGDADPGLDISVSFRLA